MTHSDTSLTRSELQQQTSPYEALLSFVDTSELPTGLSQRLLFAQTYVNYDATKLQALASVLNYGGHYYGLLASRDAL